MEQLVDLEYRFATQYRDFIGSLSDIDADFGRLKSQDRGKCIFARGAFPCDY